MADLKVAVAPATSATVDLSGGFGQQLCQQMEVQAVVVAGAVDDDDEGRNGNG